MKKIYCIILLCVCLAGYASAQCNGVFADGFESGSYSPTWTLGTGLTSGMVTTTNPAVGSYRLEGVGGGATHLTGFSTTISASTPSSISWYIYPTGNAATNYFVCGHSAMTPTNCLVFCYWYGSLSQIRFVSTTTITYPATPGQWYFIELRNVNYVSRTFDIYINNTLVQAAFPFRSTTLNNVSKVHLYNHGSGIGVWDQVTLGSVPVTLSGNVVNTSCAGTADGSIDLTVMTGTPAYSYQWSNSSMTEDITGLSVGTYSVLVTDANNCTATASYTITSPPLLIANAGADTAICAGQSIQLGGFPTAAGGTPSYTYTWGPGLLTGPNPVDTPATNTTYNVTITDNNNCSATASVTVTVNTLPVISLSITPDTVCIYTPAFALTGGSPPGGSYSGPGVVSGMFDASVAGLGIHTLHYSYTDANICSASDSSQIFVDVCTGIASFSEAEKFFISPNPVTNEIRILPDVSGRIESIEIYDVLGQKIFSQQATNGKQQTINVSALPSGIYFLKAKTETWERVAKFVKE